MSKANGKTECMKALVKSGSKITGDRRQGDLTKATLKAIKRAREVEGLSFVELEHKFKLRPMNGMNSYRAYGKALELFKKSKKARKVPVGA